MASLFSDIRFQLELLQRHSRVEWPFRNSEAARRINMGRHVRIKKHAWFSLKPECQVSIGDHTRIGRYLILSGAGTSITIEDNVLMSERVFITESNHDFSDVSKPVQSDSVSGGPVHIGSGTWIGIGVCILPGVTIGKHCVIGANATVTRNIPDYSIAAGIPAKVIKRYDFNQAAWVPAMAASERC